MILDPKSALLHATPARTLVAIGASAGGLDACTRFVGAMPVGQGIGMILVQHLDPRHESLMVALLATRTGFAVEQAVEGAEVLADHLYVIPPGAYLTVNQGKLHLQSPPDHQGARLPFDTLLESLATQHGEQTFGVVLSGTGTDGSAGLQALKAAGGFCIAQDPKEAGYDAMPSNAIATGAIEVIATAAAIPAVIQRHLGGSRHATKKTVAAPVTPDDLLTDILDAIKTGSTHDFNGYKLGTVLRRVERRMALAGLLPSAMAQYLQMLRSHPAEQDLLASDLLINVTSFFRDPKVFDYLAANVLPGLIADCRDGEKLRIWTAGCSTGEESYSLAMLLKEAIDASGRDIPVQIFASDADEDAVATARLGTYDDTIAQTMAPERLARFFIQEGSSYRVLPELRSMVAFSVQNVLSDPPFSKLDLISCRNLLIYLSPESQAKVMSVFHFALRAGGVLLLGSAETAGNAPGQFELISKPEKLYRQIGPIRHGDIGVTIKTKAASSVSKQPMIGMARQISLSDLCRRLVMDSYAPAAALIDAGNGCVFSMGPTDRYLRIAPGYPTTDLLAMATPALKIKLRAALQKAREGNKRIVADGGRSREHGTAFKIDVQPVIHEGIDYCLVCFIDTIAPARSAKGSADRTDGTNQLERELEATKADLQDALRDLETSGQEHKAVNEEALSVNEEYQSTNEELLTSKEELQSLNEELTALNSQLQETLERQRTTSNDLQNVLYSTDLATIFLDTKLNIRFFTPATKALFSVIPGDVGRPLSDLNALASDTALLTDATAVLKSKVPIEREIETLNGDWFIRRILPYRAENGQIEGVVITFANITERRHTAEALEIAERTARSANIAKSRFLAAASHDLRQPLQSLKLVQGMLSKSMHDEAAKKLLARLDDTVGAMSGMLNTLLDINQIEAGTVQAHKTAFPIDDILRRLRGEFTYVAQSQGLKLRVVHSSLVVLSDPQLLEQMMRNLLANALKYTRTGKVIIGCRRRGDQVSIEIIDTGIGIPKREQAAIFEEYHQLHNEARERSQGLGLGLSIVKRLGDLLDHHVGVQSTPNRGSCFSIAVPMVGTAAAARPTTLANTAPKARVARIMVVEDDPEIRDLMQILLRQEGHEVETAADGPLALDMVGNQGFDPQLIMADFNLPNGMDGIEVIADLRGKLHRKVPAIILTGDISTGALQSIGLTDCLHFSKPVKAIELVGAINRLLAAESAAPAVAKVEAEAKAVGSVVYIVDDELSIRSSLREVLESEGLSVLDFATAEAFLLAYSPTGDECLLVDAYLPGLNGVEVIHKLRALGHGVPTIMITGSSDVTMAVDAMKAGAMDFIEKPVSADELLAGVRRALDTCRDASRIANWHDEAAGHLAGLTKRQRQIMDMVMAGHPSKNIAADLNISQRTVENHRAAIMERTGTKSLPALARLVIAANGAG
ncbi:two-component system CheB/CheR fusion protein [Devosia sp. UYZn731]|uniref:CheR family methyltransferase n=1 Tax=Devosia sp. UYZn731 TaxID=3156345 RepID=UPI003393A529